MGKPVSKPVSDHSLQVKIILLGSPGVGKTAMALYQVHGVFRQGDGSTLPLMIHQFEDERKDLKGIIMDALTDEELELKVPCRLRAIQNSDCAMLVFAYDDRLSWDSISSKLQLLRSCLYPADRAILVGNKADIAERAVTDEEVQSLVVTCQQPKLVFFRVSCCTGQGVNYAFAKALHLGGRSKRVLWEARKVVVFAVEESRRTEEETQTRGFPQLGGRLCEALPNLMFLRKRRLRLRLDRLPTNVLLMVVRALL